MTETRKTREGNLYRRGEVYWLRWMVDGKLFQQSLQTKIRKEAERLRKEIMRPLALASKAEALTLTAARLQETRDTQAVEDGKRIPPLLLQDAWARYLAAANRPDSSERTMTGYETTWRRFIRWMEREHPDKTALRDIDPDMAGAYASSLTADGLSASTFKQYIGFLRLLWRVLDVPIQGSGNPWRNIRERRAQKLAHRHRAVTSEQLDKILEATEDPDLRDLLFALAWTGQRMVDGVMLRWDCVDFNRRVVTIYPRKTARTGKAVHIPLLPQLADMLKRRRRDVPGELVFPGLVRAYERDQSAVTKRIQKTIEIAGLEPRTRRPGIKRAVVQYGAHSLRHFYATQALAAGIPAEIVKRITGHTSDAMLEGYEHIDAALIGELAQRIGSGTGTPKALPPPASHETGSPKHAPTLESVRQIVESMTPESLEHDRQRILTMLNTATV